MTNGNITDSANEARMCVVCAKGGVRGWRWASRGASRARRGRNAYRGSIVPPTRSGGARRPAVKTRTLKYIRRTRTLRTTRLTTTTPTPTLQYARKRRNAEKNGNRRKMYFKIRPYFHPHKQTKHTYRKNFRTKRKKLIII